MSTERQIQASRENGAKSRGPVTPAGQLNSSRNAMKHGMLSGTIVLKGESEDRFLELVADLHEEFQPQTPFEESLIEDMAAARWRRMRIWGMEKAGMEHEMQKQAEMSDAASEDAATCAALAFRSLGDNSRTLDLINRYDSRYQREYLRAHRRFLEVRDRRTPPVLQPSPENPPPTEPENAILRNEPETCVLENIENAIIAERTQQVIENTVQPSDHPGYHGARAVRCAADHRIPAQAQVRCAANSKQAAQAKVRCAADSTES